MGIWKNIRDLEESLNLPELELVVSAARDKEDRQNRWLAAVNGIDLSAGDKQTAQERVEERKRFIEAQERGLSKDEFEFDELGLEIEVEE